MTEYDHDTLPPSQDPLAGSDLGSDPPQTLAGILSQIGPGLIIAGSIVGSGELIATTKTGAQAGISLLWLIIIGCFIKVFVQIELGRYALTHGETTLSALDRVPGPRLGANWILWYWLIMALVSLGQLGGIVGGVGQAMAISFPLTGDYSRMTELPPVSELKNSIRWELGLPVGVGKDRKTFDQLSGAERERVERAKQNLARELDALNVKEPRGTQARERVLTLVKLEEDLAAAKTGLADLPDGVESAAYKTQLLAVRDAEDLVQLQNRQVAQMFNPRTLDDLYWAAAITLVTVALLYRGSYDLIQNISTALVVAFTFITVGNVIALQTKQQWAIPSADILRGLSFQLPAGSHALATALATFGIIGVGANELIQYPYWCLEKGYAKSAGRRAPGDAWARRARGWMKVLSVDAWVSMVIYTSATIAFYLMGVAVLYSEGRDPDGMRMVSTLSKAYIPVFGEYAKWLFLIGAIAVLYSTFLIANAGHARVFTDGLKLFGAIPAHKQAAHDQTVSVLSVLFPLTCLAIFALGFNPVMLILLGGTLQAIMLPMLGFAALYFRYRHSDERLRPSPAWDFALILSCLGLLIAGGWSAWHEISKLLH